MKILIISFHFPPDLSAGAFRVSALVEALGDNLDEQGEIDVLTTFPNRYAQFKVETKAHEKIAKQNVCRLELDNHCNSIVGQSINFLKFVKFVFDKTKHQDYDVIFATSSKLMTAFLAAYLSKRKKIPLYLDIRDLFVDTIKDVYPGWKQLLLMPIFSNLERWTYNASTHINIVSQGFEAHLKEKTKTKNISIHTNGIDNIFEDFYQKNKLFEDKKSNKLNEQKLIKILYAGNIGEGQALEKIIPGMINRLGSQYVFKIFGDGGRFSELKKSIYDSEAAQIELYPPVKREKLLSEYVEADILFLHLNDHLAFHKVIPSKLFEYAATGKPILAGVSGFAAKFIEGNIENCEVFEPCNVEQAVSAISKLQLTSQARQNFIKQFRRKEIMQSMAAEIINLAMVKDC